MLDARLIGSLLLEKDQGTDSRGIRILLYVAYVHYVHGLNNLETTHNKPDTGVRG